MPDPQTPQQNTCFREAMAADVGSPEPAPACPVGEHLAAGVVAQCTQQWDWAAREAWNDRCVEFKDAAHDLEAAENQCSLSFANDPIALSACIAAATAIYAARVTQAESFYQADRLSAQLAFEECVLGGCVPD